MATDLRRQVTDALAFAQGQVRRLVEIRPGVYPLYTQRGRWQEDGAGQGQGQGQGLLAGMMWLFLDSGVADDPEYWRAKAEEYSRGLEARLEDRAATDLGLVFYHGAHRRWYEATVGEGRAEQRLNDLVVRAGQVTGLRFEPNGQYLRSPASADTVAIDDLLNVGAMLYAAKHMTAGQTSAEGLNAHELRRRAVQHCLSVQRVICRGDGSVAEAGVFDPKTGGFLRQMAGRGFRGDSCRSFSLAAAMYGLAACHAMTGDRRFLKTAEDQAEFWTSVTPDHGVPPWDFDAPMDGRLTVTRPDSSAAALAASALLDLAGVAHDRVRARAYEEFAMRTVETLTRPPYLASELTGWEGILARGAYDVPGGVGVDESVIWGDFFLVEAMTKAAGLL